MVGDLDQQPGCRCAIVRADKAGVFEPVICLVVAGEDDDAVLLAGKFHDEIVQRLRAGGSVDDEGVLGQIVFRELLSETGLGFGEAFAAVIARAKGDDLAGILEGARAVEVGCRLGSQSGDDGDEKGDRRRGEPF